MSAINIWIQIVAEDEAEYGDVATGVVRVMGEALEM